MKMKVLFLALLLCGGVFLANSASAAVDPHSIPGIIYEDSLITIRTRNYREALHSEDNPLKISLITADSRVFPLQPVLVSGLRFAQARLPQIHEDADGLFRVIVKISGGDIPEDEAEGFTRFFSKQSWDLGVEIDRGTALSDDPALDESPLIPSDTLSGVEIRAAADVDVVTGANQPFIQTLPALTSVGEAGKLLTVEGPLKVEGLLQVKGDIDASAADVFANKLHGELLGNASSATVADRALSAESFDDGAGNTLKLVGGHSVTLNTQGPTNLILPSSGTLVTRDSHSPFAYGGVVDLDDLSSAGFLDPMHLQLDVKDINVIKLVNSSDEKLSITKLLNGRLGQRVLFLFEEGGPIVFSSSIYVEGLDGNRIRGDEPDTIALVGTTNQLVMKKGSVFELIFNGTYWSPVSFFNFRG